MIELAPWTEWQIVECKKHYALMDAYREWWKKWVLPTKNTVANPNREGEFITYYEDVYNILTRQEYARDELVQLSVMWCAAFPTEPMPSIETVKPLE